MIIVSFVILQLQWAYSCSLPVNDEIVVVLAEGVFEILFNSNYMVSGTGKREVEPYVVYLFSMI